MSKIAVRVFVNRQKTYDRVFEGDLSDESLMWKITQDYQEAITGPLHMIEFEFFDIDDLSQRFWRIGTDPAAMVMPIHRPNPILN